MSVVFDDDLLYRDYLAMQQDSILMDMKDKLNNLLTNN